MTDKKLTQEDTQFKKGTSGNKRGRPPGSKNKTSIVKEALLERSGDLMVQNLEKVVSVVIQKAEEGDLTAAKMILDRLIPVKKAVEFNTDKLGKGGIVINIEKLTANPHLAREEEQVVDGEFSIEKN